MSDFVTRRVWIRNRKKMVPSVIVVIMLVLVSAVAMIVSSDRPNAELTIVNVSANPAEASVDQGVDWAVVVDLQYNGQRGNGLLFTWDWDDGTYTVNHLASVNDSDIATDVQTHAWAESGLYEVMVSVWDCYGSDESKRQNVSVTVPFIVNEGITTRSVDYRWHDMFAHELGPWYYDRLMNYGDEYTVTDSYPYLYVWEGSPPGNMHVNTFMQLDVDATDIPEVNMNENPEFLPLFGYARGGNAELDWHMNYITREESEAKLSVGANAWYDGWYIAWNGTITLDERAAKGVLGITEPQLDDFDTWWAVNSGGVKADWESWLNHEAGNDRLAIYSMYEYDLTFVYFVMDAEMVGEEVLITFDTVSWGMEALMTRWLHEAFMPTEWYMEDMYLNATIGPDDSDMWLSAAVGYALTASEIIEDGTPCWSWQAMLQDCVESSSEYPISDFDPYADFESFNTYPGNEWYHTMMPYDYTPGAWNLSEGETLSFEWPAGEVLFLVDDPTGVGSGTVDGALDFWSTMTVDYSEPMPADAPGNVAIDTDTRQMTFTGPFDMWTWSRDQVAHSYLSDEWDRLGILPYGMPYIEFRAADEMNTPPAASFTIAPETGTVDTVFSFDASSSFDLEDPAESLMVRWDWESDGIWDTTYSVNKTAEHQFATVGTFVVTLEVTDDDGMVDQTSLEVSVMESPVPSPHDPILIDGDRDFLPENGVIGGSGTYEDPYIIGGWIIYPIDGNGITVLNTKKYLTIRDTQIIGNAYTCMAGVYLEDIEHAALQNLTIGGFMMGVGARSAADLSVVSCQIAWNSWGVHAFLCGSVLVAENEISHSVIGPGNYLGIDISDSESVIVAMNDLMDNGQGIRVYAADDALVLNNIIAYNTSIGIQFAYSSGLVFGNSITSKIDGMILYGCTDTIVEGNDLVWDSTSSASLFGIEFTSCTNLRVSGNVVDSYMYGIGTHYHSQPPADSEGVTVSWNTVSSCGGSGMRIHYVSDLTVTANVFLSNGIGMDVDSTASALLVHHNDFVGNSVQVIEDPFCVGNEWDDGYPSGGNYWDDYSGADLFNGPSQDIPGSDGIGDTPYLIDTVHMDRYPLVEGSPITEPSLICTIYDMFEEPWGPWWDARVASSTWDTERILTEDAGDVTYLYSLDPNPEGLDDQGLIYAPYRWNIDATSIPNMDVHAPVVMPVLGSGQVPNAEATVDVYSQYIYPGTSSWWEDYWVSTWSGESDWVGNSFVDYTDGYYLGTVYTVTMNRAAAEEWLGMPMAEVPADWWAANGDIYESLWEDWIVYQGNEVFDIFNGYEWPYYDLGTFMSLTGDSTEIVLDIAHLSWGWEALLTRWLDYTQLSVHQPYFEDITVQIDYKDSMCDFYMDAVCQWSMHAVKQNASAPGDNAPCAWAWEPLGFDFIPSRTAHPVSQYDPYYGTTYQSWNCGDPLYGTEVPYEVAPSALSLPSYAKLVIELPSGDALPGYYAEPVPDDAIMSVWSGDTSDYDAIRYSGEMDLGFALLGGCTDWTYDPVSKVMTINGPWDFTNPRDDGYLYHGAPWIEFNVIPMPSNESLGAEGSTATLELCPAAASVGDELASLVGTMCAVMLATVAMVAGVGRRREC